jgi:hypothetical protein
MKKLTFGILLLGSSALLSSCASIVSHSQYPVTINCTPTSNITITDKKGVEIFKGNTPVTMKLKAGNGFFSGARYSVKFTANGYDEKVITINSKLDGWYFGNILLGGVIGMLIVDPATGAMWKLDTEYINETLVPHATSQVPEMQVRDIKDIPNDWKPYLTKID